MLFFAENFFALAYQEPQILIDFLSIYNTRYSIAENTIEDEQFDLVYLGHLSYTDTCLMTYFKRRYWLQKLKKITMAQNGNQTGDLMAMLGAQGQQ